MNEHDAPGQPPTPPASPDDNTSPAQPLGPLAYRSPWAWMRFLFPAILGLTADLYLKSWAFPAGVPADPMNMPFAGRNPGDNPVWEVVPKFLGFTTTVNQGAVFGIWQGKVSVFLGFSVVALAIILWVFAGSSAKHRVVHFALGLITAGALGNLYDRAMFHGVRDMLRFLCFHFPPMTIFGHTYPSGPLAADGTADWYPYLFNIADVCLCVCVPLLIVRWLFVKDAPAAVPAKA